MTTFTDYQLYEIRLSARSIAEEEIASRGIEDPDVIDFLAAHLFIMRDRWASFDDDADADSYEPVIANFFGETEDTNSKLYAIDPKSADLEAWDHTTDLFSPLSLSGIELRGHVENMQMLFGVTGSGRGKPNADERVIR